MPLADLTEATADTTTEDISSYAESVVKEVQAERQGALQTDGEIIADTSSATKTRAEVNSSTDTAKVETDGEETGEDSQAPEWLDDDVKAEAAAYGIDESDLSEFASREELDKVLRLFDKKALDAGRKALAESEEAKTRNEKGQFVKKEDGKEEAEESKPAKQSGDRYEVTLSKDLYDDEIVNEFSRMRDHYESRLERLESFIAQEQTRSEENRFDTLVDSLGHSELFGKTGNESPKELERRKDLLVAVKAQMIGLERLGRPTDMNDQLISRVANMVYADELGKKRLKQQTQKISKQNQLRQGGSPTRAQPVSENPRDEFDRLYKELERS
jgi:hypothetical protein